MGLGWCMMVSLRQSLNNQTREYTNNQILKKALFSMFPSYSIARLHGWNAENFQVMQVSCKLYNWKDNSYAESCIYKTLNILWERLSKTWQTLDNVLYYVCSRLNQIKELMKTQDENSEYILEQSRGMSLGRQSVDLGSGIEKESIISLHHLSEDHLYMLNRSVVAEVKKRKEK